MEFWKRFDWTDTQLTETEKQAVEDILVEYHDMFARQRMDIGMNTEFNVRLTPKDDKAVYSQNLTMPIHLKEDLIVELVLMLKYGLITVLPFSKYAKPIFAQRKPNWKLRLSQRKLWISEKSTPWLQMIILLITTHLAPCQTKQNTWQEKPCSASLAAPKRITVCRWRTTVRRKCLLLILLAEPLPTKDLHKVSADLCLLFHASCASTWTQSLKLTNVLNTWMILESQSIMLRTSPGTFGQSSSAFAMQDWNWQLKSATLESGNLNFLEKPFHPREYRHKLTRFKIFRINRD